MTVVYVETYVVKPDKLAEFAAYCKDMDAYIKRHPELIKDFRSLKRFSHMIGGNWGGYVTMIEAESLAAVEKYWHSLMADKEFMKVYAEWAAIIVPGTDSISIWNPVP